MADNHQIHTEQALEQLLGEPMDRVGAKVINQLNAAMIESFRLSPLVFVATVGAQGVPDTSPKGDSVGFVKVDRQGNLLIPEHPGNRLRALLLPRNSQAQESLMTRKLSS